jgi:hypothetical protein
MLGTVKVVLFASALLLRVAPLYAGANSSLCCDSFDGTTATNCTPTGDGKECNRTLVVLDCENFGGPNALECSPQNVKLATSRLLGGGGNGQNCRCVTVAFGSP